VLLDKKPVETDIGEQGSRRDATYKRRREKRGISRIINRTDNHNGHNTESAIQGRWRHCKEPPHRKTGISYHSIGGSQWKETNRLNDEHGGLTKQLGGGGDAYDPSERTELRATGKGKKDTRGKDVGGGAGKEGRK